MEDSFNWDENNQDDRLEVLEEQERLSAEADAKEAEALVAKDEEEENKEKSGPERLLDTATTVGGAAYGGLEYLNNQKNVGIARGLNGIFTQPQRMWDMGTGEVERQEAENGEYSPGWDPFREFIDENEPKTGGNLPHKLALKWQPKLVELSLLVM